MRKVATFKNKATLDRGVENAKYILALLRGKTEVERERNSFILGMTEKARQYFTWGAEKMKVMISEDGALGLQFSVSGLKFRGRVRIYLNEGTDLFDVEFVRARKEECVGAFEGVYFDELHNVCHRFIERDDDPEV